jgi:tryptophanyl-tRNA synthetase
MSAQNAPQSEHTVTPWEVKGYINYAKLTEQFGCDTIDGMLIKRFEQVTNVKAHTWLRRGLFFSNKDLNLILDDYEKGTQIYLYTGRGPSSEAMHLGHMIPFMFTKYLQDALDAILVIQMSDDEKFFFKGPSEGKTVNHYNRLAYENAKDIIACGFNPDKTYIFSNFKSCGGALYQNAVRVLNSVTGTRIRATYGLDLENTNGQLCWPSFQCAPAYSSSFPDILHPDGEYTEEHPDGSRDYVGPQIRCLVPMAIDQDPYFRMARDFADRNKSKGYLKPATIHSQFLVGLGGVRAKMSSSGTEPSLFLNDELKQISKKIMKYAFSGGKTTVEEHRQYGGNLSEDVSYQYLLYFMDDDAQLSEIAHKYRSGEMLSGDIKKIMAERVCEVIGKHQENRAAITPEILKKFFVRNRSFDLSKSTRETITLESDDNYITYGVNFDKTFGATPTPEAAAFEAK